MEKRYMTIPEALEYTGMGESTFMEMMKQTGKLIYQPGGGCGRRYVDKVDIDDAFDRMKQSKPFKYPSVC